LSVEVVDSGTATGYRHEAFFYEGSDDFMSGTLDFIRSAVASEEPILVVVGPSKTATLRHELKADAARVLFADMTEIGTNPARIIPAWHQFVKDHEAKGRRVRGIGEPIWVGRSQAELDECERHEALLNVAFDDPDFWLLCLYDTASLAANVIHEARRNHRFVQENGVSRPSGEFPGLEALAAPFERPLSQPPSQAVGLHFDSSLGEVRRFVVERAGALGLPDHRVDDLMLAANEVATNSLVHGGGGGMLLMWRDSENVICEVRDRGNITSPLAGRECPDSPSEGRRGLWIANQVCELVQIRSTPTGTIVRLHVRTR
jgi:anti-sigma regulatory factor (Ser/Thr protein kinase)